MSTIISSNQFIYTIRIQTKLLISGRSLYVTNHVFKHEILCLLLLKKYYPSGSFLVILILFEHHFNEHLSFPYMPSLNSLKMVIKNQLQLK